MTTQAEISLVRSHFLQGKVQAPLHGYRDLHFLPLTIFPISSPESPNPGNALKTHTDCYYSAGLGPQSWHRPLPGMLFPMISAGQTSTQSSKSCRSISTSFLILSYMAAFPCPACTLPCLQIETITSSPDRCCFCMHVT